MFAVQCTKYGSPEVLEIQQIEKPIPQENQIRIQVLAGTVTPSDVAFRKGDPFIIKLMYGLTKPRLATQGVEFAGIVDAVGVQVNQFKKGDQVFGTSPNTFGAHAEYLCLEENVPIALKPTNVNFEQAASIVDGATTALTFLRDVAKIQKGQKVLINGASGAVGAYAVQLAKFFGAIVTGVCSGANIALVNSLGADNVIDYTENDFTQNGETYDIIFDAIGKSSFPKCKNSLVPNGMYLSTVPSLGIVLQMLWTSRSKGKRAKFVAAGLMQTKENLLFLKELVEAGNLKPVIDKSYPLQQIAEAHRYVETGHKNGSVVLMLQHN